VKRRSRLRVVPLCRAPLLAALPFLAASCASTEPASVPPHVNPSPEKLELSSAAPPASALVGIDTERNEGDSLDNLTVLPGVRIASVEPSGAAVAAGLRAGDVILSVDGVAVDDPDGFEATVARAEPGRSLRIEARRDTVVLEATVSVRAPVGTTTPPRERYRVDPMRSRAGFTTVVVAEGDVERTGARIVRFFPESPLPAAGLVVGDIVVALGTQPVGSAQELVTALLERCDLGEEVVLEAVRNGARASFEVTLWEPARRLSVLAALPLFAYENRVAPSRTQLSILDFWVFSLFSYRPTEGECEYRILSLLRFGTGRGELVDEKAPDAGAAP
jgi:serine protease Do